MNNTTITTAIFILVFAAAVVVATKHPLIQAGDLTVQDCFNLTVINK